MFWKMFWDSNFYTTGVTIVNWETAAELDSDAALLGQMDGSSLGFEIGNNV